MPCVSEESLGRSLAVFSTDLEDNVLGHFMGRLEAQLWGQKQEPGICLKILRPRGSVVELN